MVLEARRPVIPLVAALLLYAVWTAATWWFEGRTGLLTRADAGTDRIIYAFVVNLMLGIGGGLLLLRARAVASDPPRLPNVGFDSVGRAALGTVAGLLLGGVFYWLQGAPSRAVMIVGNGFAQVFVVSAAEIVVCWAVVGTALRDVLSPWLGRAATVVAGAGAALLFGLYHFAHSPPFDTWSMVGFLSVVGMFTSAFFFTVRDTLATTVFHNALGTFGVVQALVSAGAVEHMQTPQWSLFGTAALTLVVLWAGGVWLRGGFGR
ncbi:MAG: hypothetical protein ACOYLX_15500 [Burkholderiaceae bacterium]